MISIDLSPVELQHARLSDARCARLLQSSCVAVALSLAIVVALAVKTHRLRVDGVHELRSQVEELERAVQIEKDSLRILQEQRLKQMHHEAIRRSIVTLIAMLESIPQQALSLVKVELEESAVKLYGFAQDSNGASSLLEFMSAECPRAQLTLEALRSLVIADLSVVSFIVKMTLPNQLDIGGVCGGKS